jgi:hypothetical protein
LAGGEGFAASVAGVIETVGVTEGEETAAAVGETAGEAVGDEEVAGV